MQNVAQASAPAISSTTQADQAWDAFYRTWAAQATRWCRWRAQDDHRGDDLAQEVLLAAFVAYRDGRLDITSSAGIRAWFWTTIRNQWICAYRHSRRYVEYTPAADYREAVATATVVSTRELLDARSAAVHAALSALPSTDQHVLRADLTDVPRAHVAAMLGIPLSTHRQRLQRARARLRRVLAHAASREALLSP